MSAAKRAPKFVCSRCMAPYQRWPGATCRSCGACSTSIIDIATARARGLPLPVSLLGKPGAKTSRRLRTGLAALDLTFGGGIAVPSSALFAGSPGAGKSTAALQAAAHVARRSTAVYASVEESVDRLHARCERFGFADRAKLVPIHVESVDELVRVASGLRPALIVCDSASKLAETMHSREVPIVERLHATAHEQLHCAMIVISHVNAAGEISGPAAKRHATDAVIVVEGDGSNPIRTLRAPKNRDGATDVRACLRMTDRGFVDDDPSAAGHDARRKYGPGVALGLLRLDGRVQIVEVEAMLTTPTSNPRRIIAHGCPGPRVATALAIVERAGAAVDGDVTVRLAGGITSADVSLDAALVGAIWSAAAGRAIPAGTVLAGEVSLAGGLRPPGVEAPEGYRLLGPGRLVEMLSKSHLRAV